MDVKPETFLSVIHAHRSDAAAMYWAQPHCIKKQIIDRVYNIYKVFFFMQVARHTRPEGQFKVWATNQPFFQGPLPPTPGAEKGLPTLQSIRM